MRALFWCVNTYVFVLCASPLLCKCAVRAQVSTYALAGKWSDRARADGLTAALEQRWQPASLARNADDWSQLPMDARPDVRSDARAIAHAVAQAVPVAYTLSHRLQGSALVRSQFGAHTSADYATHHFTSIAPTDGTADAHPRAQSGIAACTCGGHGPGTLSGFFGTVS